eukprot:5507781-Pleurochrysis_carterae.AAC.1
MSNSKRRLKRATPFVARAVPRERIAAISLATDGFSATDRTRMALPTRARAKQRGARGASGCTGRSRRQIPDRSGRHGRAGRVRVAQRECERAQGSAWQDKTWMMSSLSPALAELCGGRHPQQAADTCRRWRLRSGVLSWPAALKLASIRRVSAVVTCIDLVCRPGRSAPVFVQAEWRTLWQQGAQNVSALSGVLRWLPRWDSSNLSCSKAKGSCRADGAAIYQGGDRSPSCCDRGNRSNYTSRAEHRGSAPELEPSSARPKTAYSVGERRVGESARRRAAPSPPYTETTATPAPLLSRDAREG